MPRYVSVPDEQNNPSYGPFFQSSFSTIDNIEIARARREAIAAIENYQELIKDGEERKNKIQQLLIKGNLSETRKEKAIEIVQSLEAELAYHKAKLTSLIESRPSLREHFSLHS